MKTTKKKKIPPREVDRYQLKCRVLALSELLAQGEETLFAAAGASYGLSLLLWDVANDLERLQDDDD